MTIFNIILLARCRICFSQLEEQLANGSFGKVQDELVKLPSRDCCVLNYTLFHEKFDVFF